MIRRVNTKVNWVSQTVLQAQQGFSSNRLITDENDNLNFNISRQRWPPWVSGERNCPGKWLLWLLCVQRLLTHYVHGRVNAAMRGVWRRPIFHCYCIASWWIYASFPLIFVWKQCVLWISDAQKCTTKWWFEPKTITMKTAK